MWAEKKFVVEIDEKYVDQGGYGFAHRNDDKRAYLLKSKPTTKCHHIFIYSNMGIAAAILILERMNIGTLLRCCVLGQSTSPSNASLDSGENEYLVGQRWQYVR